MATLGSFIDKLEWVAIISVKKVVFGWISGLKEAKNDQKFANQCYILSVIMQWLQKQTVCSHEIKTVKT